MAVFMYTALDRQGRRLSGTVPADSRAAAMDTVMGRGLSPVSIEEQRNGIGHGDVEIEGMVAQILALDPTHDSRFLINGRTVVARPGETAIREGNRSRNISKTLESSLVSWRRAQLPTIRTSMTSRNGRASSTM